MADVEVARLAMFRRYNLQLRRSFKKFAVKAGDGVLKLGLPQLLQLVEHLCICPQLVGKGGWVGRWWAGGGWWPN
jgi:hypothetical protein